MLFPEEEVRGFLEYVRAAFPRLTAWEYLNERDESYTGFSLWGEFVPNPNEPVPRSFFITFDTHRAAWKGHLTIGKPSYFWTSADVGDAYLLDTVPCASLEQAVRALKDQAAGLFAALSGSAVEPGESLGEVR